VVVKRSGLLWDLDLTEGIDFSIYLLGAFEPRTQRLFKRILKPGDTVLDIGANIGAHTLPLAVLAGEQGRVIAFEPTGYGVNKMRANIRLNEELSSRIVICQAMLVAKEHEPLAAEAYARWPLFDRGREIHGNLRGQLMDTRGAVAMTLDQALHRLEAKRVDFIKLDVDGHEWSVLAGAKETLNQWKPPILMELCPYMYESQPRRFDDMLELLGGLGYFLRDANTGKALPLEPAELRKLIRVGSSRNGLLHR